MLKKLKNRIISGISALSMLASSGLSYIPTRAEDAHKVIFDMELLKGATYYADGFHDDDMTDTELIESENLKNEDGSDIGGAYVWTAESAAKNHNVVYNIRFSCSGVAYDDPKYAQDTMKITIPPHIFKLSDGEYGDQLELPVPSVDELEKDGNGDYVTDHEFAYRIDDDGNYVIFNIKPISSGEVYEFPIAYKTTHMTYDYTDLSETDPCQVSLSLTTWDKDAPGNEHEITDVSAQIPVHINTKAELMEVKKQVATFGNYPAVMDSSEIIAALGAGALADVDIDSDHYYVVWGVTSTISEVTQRYNFTLRDTGNIVLTGRDAENNDRSVTGEVVAVGLSGKPAYTSGTEDTLEGLAASGKRTDHVITAFPKDEIDALSQENATPAVYSASNTADAELTPADNKDKTTEKSGSAVLKYEVKDPNYIAPIEKYDVKKYGLYNSGMNRVGNFNNITSYNMDVLTKDKVLSGIMYENFSEAYAYPKTVAHFNKEIREMTAETIEEDDGNGGTIQRLIVTAVGDPSRVYEAVKGDNKYTVTNGSDTPEEFYVSDTGLFAEGDDSLDLTKLKMIAGQELSEQYGHDNAEYIVDDHELRLANYESPLFDAEPQPLLTSDDYYFDYVNYSVKAASADYDTENMEYLAYNVEEFGADDILTFYAYPSGSGEAVEVGTYNLSDNTAVITRRDLVSSITGSRITFRSDTVTGYRIKAENKYYYFAIDSKPSITLKPSDYVKNYVEEAEQQTVKKMAVNNYVSWKVRNVNTDEYSEKNDAATDYLTEAIRNSSIKKSVLDEDNIIIGQDGKQYSTGNDTLNRQFTVAWKTVVGETITGADGSSGTQYVSQQSGTFYDLLPAYSDIIPGSVNVSINRNGIKVPLSRSEFTVLPRQSDYNESGRKLLTVQVDAPTDSTYEISYVTVHTHEDLQDHGYIAVNAVAYQTGNAEIANGSPDDGGKEKYNLHDYMVNFDPDNNGAERFLYSEAKTNILALIQTSSGIFKKVSSEDDPTPRRNTVVHQNGEYTYSIRMKNSSTTKAYDIAILDSLENYQNGYNSALSKVCDWKGTLTGFDLSYLESKMEIQGCKDDLELFLYISDDDVNRVNFENSLYSDENNRKVLLQSILEGPEDSGDPSGLSPEETVIYNRDMACWTKVDDWRDLSGYDLTKVKAFIVYIPPPFCLGKSESLSFRVNMTAPDYLPSGRKAADGVTEIPPVAYNNVYRSFTNIPIKNNEDVDPETAIASGDSTYFYTHYDYTQVEFRTAGTLEFGKIETGHENVAVKDTIFRLAGTSAYGTAVNELLITDSNGMVRFTGLEKGTYTLTEEQTDEDHIVNPTPHTVTVTPHGDVMLVTIDGYTSGVDEAGNVLFYDAETDSYEYASEDRQPYRISNDRRIHSQVQLTKKDKLTDAPISGAVFTLTGTSDYNTVYSIRAVSDRSGIVDFGDIELSSSPYTITEVLPAEGYIPAANTYNLWVREGAGGVAAVTLEGGDSDSSGVIYNKPFAHMDIRKADSVTGNAVNNVTFTLTPRDSATTDELQTAVYELERIAAEAFTDPADIAQYVKWDGSLTQTYSSGNVGPEGEYLFGNLVEGSYILTETPSDDYTKNVTSYNVNVTRDGSGYCIEFEDTDEMEYIKRINGGDGNVAFEKTDKENATSYRIFNDKTYDDERTVIKSWIGDPMESGFPVLHLSTEEPEKGLTKVTIGTAFKTSFSNKKSSITSMERSATLPSNVTVDTIPPSFMNNDEGETGHFYSWVDGNTLKWWSDADIIYLPRDCNGLFRDMTKIREMDLSDFYVDKVTTFFNTFKDNKLLETITFNNSEGDNFVNGDNITTMRSMFQGCEKLQSVDIGKLQVGASLTNVGEMFRDCKALTGLDLRGFGNCPGLTDISGWFWNCINLKYIDLSNFETSTNLTQIGNLFNHVGMGASGTGNVSAIDQNAGCEVFAKGKWETGVTTRSRTTDDYFRIKLYGYIFKNAQDNNDAPSGYQAGEPLHLDVVKYEDFQEGIDAGRRGQYGSFYYNGNINNNNARVWGSYFNDANSDYYREFCMTTYGEPPRRNNALNSTRKAFISPLNLMKLLGNSAGADDEETTYNNFTLVKTNEEKEDTDASDSDIGKKYSYEYVTSSAGTENPDGSFTVDEEIYLIVAETYKKSDGKYYTRSAEYKYDQPVTAVWRNVDRSGTSQWQCDLKVHNSDDDVYAWEDKLNGFNSTALQSSPLFAEKGRTPIITNSSIENPVGGLEITKKLADSQGQALHSRTQNDKFWFRVEMWKPETNADGRPIDANGNVTDDTSRMVYNQHYTMLPFDENGVAYYQLEADETIEISGIPQYCKYSVTEINDAEHPMPENNGYTQKSAVDTTGFIKGKDTVSAEITNEVITHNITVSKDVELWEITDGGTPVRLDSTDTRTVDWENEDFSFKAVFSNLMADYGYKYYINNVESGSFTADANGKAELEFTLNSAQHIEFRDIPTGAEYIINEKEVTGLEENEETETWHRINSGESSEGSNAAATLGTADDTVTFTNKKIINTVTESPITKVRVKVVKHWQNSDGTPKTEGLPDELNVYLGRVAVETDEDGEENEVTSKLLTIRSADIVPDDNGGWEYVFDDMDKYYNLNGHDYLYKYFVTESPLVDYDLVDPDEELSNGSVISYARDSAGEDYDYIADLTNRQKMTYSLTIGKTVKGNFGNRSKGFGIFVQLQDADGAALVGDGFRVTDSDGVERDLTLDGSTIKITVAHDETFVFHNLPEGARVSVWEQDYSKEGYTSSAELDGAEYTDRELFYMTQDRELIYTNERKGTLPTGITLASANVLLFASMVLGGWLILNKKRREE